jgi:phage/plasmid-associated DNA primase
MRKTRNDKQKIKELSDKYGIDEEEIEKIIESQYRFIKNTIEKIDFKNDLSEEEFNKIKKNFNIPCIGKIYTNYYQYCKVNGLKYERIKKSAEEISGDGRDKDGEEE